MILRNTLSETNLNSFCGTVFEREFVILAMKEAAELSGGTPVYWYEKVPPVRQWFTARFTGLRSDKTPFEVLDLRKDDMVLEYPDGRIETYPAGMIDSVGYHHLEGAHLWTVDRNMVVLPLFSGKAISTLRSWAFYNRWYRRKKAFLAGQGVDVQVIEKEIPPP